MDTLAASKQTEDLQQTLTELRQVFNASAPLCVIEKDFIITRVNEAFTSFFGISQEEALQRKCHEIWKGHLCHTPDCILERTLEGQQRCEYEVETRIADGTAKSCIVSALPYRSANGTVIGLVQSFVDITKRKQADERQKLTAHILELLNISSEKPDVIHEILVLIKAFTGFDSIGLCLRESDQYPFHDSLGAWIDSMKDEKQHPDAKNGADDKRYQMSPSILAAIYGQIIRGHRASPLSSFTKSGSLWTNNATELLAFNEDLWHQAEETSNPEGFESVAVIALRSDNETIGLLQLNDRRQGMFSTDLIHFFEGIGASISIAFEHKRMEREVLKAVEKEQRRIGQDLHDGLVQHLSGIAFMSQLLERHLKAKAPEESNEAKEITHLINQSIAHARHLASGLFPLGLKTDGILSVLEELADYIEKLYQVPCRFHAEYSIGNSKKHLVNSLNMETQSHYYRIAQEAISNAIKHAAPKSIQVRLIDQGNAIILQVQDDGKGIPDPLPENKGMGLRSMRYRASMIGASLQIAPVPEGGTRVTCAIKPAEQKNKTEEKP